MIRITRIWKILFAVGVSESLGSAKISSASPPNESTSPTSAATRLVPTRDSGLGSTIRSRGGGSTNTGAAVGGGGAYPYAGSW